LALIAGPPATTSRRSKGHRLAADNRAIVCQPCNEAKGSLSLQRFANRLARTGDPRSLRVAAFLETRLFTFHSQTCDKT
jgi:hypothetical protein